MRDWMKQLSSIQKEHVHDIEFLFGISLQSKEEYEDICKKLPKEHQTMIGYTSKKEFFHDYPSLLYLKTKRKNAAGYAG